MKKKIFALALAAVMLVSGAMTVFAAETISADGWWGGGPTKTNEATTTKWDLADGETITFTVKAETPALEGATLSDAFLVEVYDADGNYFTTTSLGDCWFAGAVNTGATVDKGEQGAFLAIGETMTATVTRSGKDVTVVYKNEATGVSKTCKGTAGADFGADVKVHLVAQFGTFSVAEKVADAPANPDVPAKGDMSTVMTYVVLLAGAALVVVAAKKRFA